MTRDLLENELHLITKTVGRNIIVTKLLINMIAEIEETIKYLYWSIKRGKKSNNKNRISRKTRDVVNHKTAIESQLVNDIQPRHRLEAIFDFHVEQNCVQSCICSDYHEYNFPTCM